MFCEYNLASEMYASEMPGKEEGNGHEDLQFSGLLTVCHRLLMVVGG